MSKLRMITNLSSHSYGSAKIENHSTSMVTEITIQPTEPEEEVEKLYLNSTQIDDLINLLHESSEIR